MKNRRVDSLVKDEAFKSFILKKALYVKGKNIKLGDEILTYSKLYGNELFEIPDVFPSVCACVRGSCGKYCKGCKKACYVAKSYKDLRGKAIKKGHARRTIAMRYYPELMYEALTGQLARKRNKPEFLRIHQSGEIESSAEFETHIKVAKDHPETIFYMYTKAFDIVIPYLLQHENEFPKNFIILISIWNEYGIKEYNAVKHMDNIKAFVVNTGYDYSKHGIIPTCKCGAYNGRKMNHETTCYICKKCMLIAPEKKVILCDEH